VKKALSDATSLFVIVGEKSLVDIRNMVQIEEQEFASGKPCDGEAAQYPDVVTDSSINVVSDDNEKSSSSSSSSSTAHQEEIEVVASNNVEDGVLKTKKLRVKDLYKLTKPDVQLLVSILQVIIPLWSTARSFSESNDTCFSTATLFGRDNRTLAEAYFRLNLFRCAEKHYLAAAAESPDDSNLINLIGAMWNKVQNYEKALEYVVVVVVVVGRMP
jgi:negative regulator of replication initiation